MPAKTVMLVDDDPDFVMAVAAMLRRRGLNVVVATDAAAAVSTAIREQPDVAVLDIGLPGGGGITVMEHMRALPRLAALPVVILSGRDPAVYRDAALAAGAVAYLSKPVDEEELLAALKLAIPTLEVSEPVAEGIAARADLAGRLVMLVDDDEDLLTALSAMLGTRGMRVTVAGDAVTATSIAVRQQPDVVVLDIGLPGGDGTTVMRRLHALPQLAGVPVVILSGRDPEQYREAALAAGAAAYLSKPVDEETLIDALTLALSA